MKSLFLEKIMDTAWLIKQSTSGYKLYRNINMLATILHDTIRCLLFYRRFPRSNVQRLFFKGVENGRKINFKISR